jgi:hypothetical protein
MTRKRARRNRSLPACWPVSRCPGKKQCSITGVAMKCYMWVFHDFGLAWRAEEHSALLSCF